MPQFTGQLNRNEVYGAALYNAIIGYVFHDRIADSEELVDLAREDGGLYGDTKLHLAADVLASRAWPDTGDGAQGGNVLEVKYNKKIDVQAIEVNTFRQVALTLDDILSKRPFTSEGSFGQFYSLLEGMLGNTKRIYDVTTYNTFLGNDVVADQVVEVDTANLDADAQALAVAEKVANVISDLTKVGTKYNELGHITKFGKGEIKIIWNSMYKNKFQKVALPVVYHNDGIFDFKHELNKDYFGIPVTSADAAEGGVIAGNKVAAANTVFAKVEKIFNEGEANEKHYFPGMPLDVDTTVGGSTAQFKYAETYQVPTEDVYCKIFIKLPPFMSGFEQGTSFYNAKSLRTNRYLTWGHNTLEHLKAYPCITIKEAAAA